ncbi:MAG: AAA family ATPase, partial [Endomicrobium sp.]|nr:AAA family ATPase [Endomicrobium sp.]
MRKLPIGTQTFEKLRDNGAIYVDKSKHILDLINNGSVYFLSRPRRFGKSLLISTIKELFKGSKDLFEELYIYDKWDWAKRNPVIHLDFAELTYSTAEELKFSLNKFVELTAEDNNLVIDKELTLSMKFAQLIEQLHKKDGKQVVILVDEYDKPLIDNLSKEEIYSEVK